MSALEPSAPFRARRPSPELVAAWSSAEAPADPDASGFLSPFYPGGTLHFGDPIPAGVLTTLAGVHAAAAAMPAPGWAWAFDAAHVDRLHAGVGARAGRVGALPGPDADPAAWGARLVLAASVRRRCARRPSACRARLPMAICTRPTSCAGADGSPVIIDWGNACLAPPMLDLANIVELGSPQWEIYVAAYRAAGGEFDPLVAERAYWWAKAMVGLMYVAWAVDNSDRAPALIAQIEAANARLADLPDAADATLDRRNKTAADSAGSESPMPLIGDLAVTTLILTVAIAARYVAIAWLVHALVWGRKDGRVRGRRLNRDRPKPATIRNELKLSLLSSWIYALPAALVIEAWKHGGTLVYLDIGTVRGRSGCSSPARSTSGPGRLLLLACTG